MPNKVGEGEAPKQIFHCGKSDTYQEEGEVNMKKLNIWK
jgi:hypothetical protein